MDLKHTKRLEEEQKLALLETDKKLQQWKTFKSDYEALKDRLTTLPDKVTHDVTVPLGPLAFMPGKIVHTNEILVLLGDNWFVERSAKQATEIIGRRIKTVEQQIKELQAQRHLLEPRLEFTKNLPGGSKNEEYFEIQEEFDPEKEKLWREQHKKSVQRQKKKEKQERKTEEGNPVLTDVEVWRRLDALERQESERQELQKIQDLDVTKKSEEHTWLSPAVEERSRKVRFKEEEEEEEEVEDSSSMEESDYDSEEEDSDDFSSESEEEDRVGIRHGKTQVIRFSHSRLQSQEQVEDFDEASNEVKSPRDIYRLVKQGTKSILKNNGGVKKKVKKKSETERAAGHNKASSVPAAFSGVVVERRVLEAGPSFPAEEDVLTDSTQQDASRKTASPEAMNTLPPQAMNTFPPQAMNTAPQTINTAPTQDIPKPQKPARVSKFKAQRQNFSNF
ncbi:uncharacterized protein LOC111136120 [Crassostrea virginica]